MPHDPLGHFVGLPDKQRAVRSALGIEALAGNGTPAPFLGDAADGLGVAGEVVVASLLARRRHVTERMDAYLELCGRVPESLAGFPIQIDQGPEAPRLTSDDGDHQGKPQRARTGE